MKKLFALLATGSLALSLVGCSSGTAAATTTEETAAAEETVVAEEVEVVEDAPVYFYLVRHGQTMFNAREVMQGWVDSPLTELGVNQAKGLGEGLEMEGVDFVAAYASVSERAADTAHYALGSRDGEIPVTLSENFKEFNFGELEATPNDEAWANFDLANLNFMELSFEEWGGESMQDVIDRSTGELETIAEEYSAQGGGNILVGSHGMTIMAVIMGLGTTDDMVAMGSASDTNCSVTILKWEDGEWTFESIFDTSYRDEGMEALGLTVATDEAEAEETAEAE